MERDNFLICKHGDMDTHSYHDTYYTIHKDAYNDWRKKGKVVIYMSWGVRIGYPFRPSTTIQFRWFKELTDAVKVGLKSQNKKLFEQFEQVEKPVDEIVSLKDISPEEVYILDYEKNQTRLYLVRREEYHSPTIMCDYSGPSAKGLFVSDSDHHKWGECQVGAIGNTSTTIPVMYTFNSLTYQAKKLFKETAPKLYQHFEQYYTEKPVVLGKTFGLPGSIDYYVFSYLSGPDLKIYDGSAMGEKVFDLYHWKTGNHFKSSDVRGYPAYKFNQMPKEWVTAAYKDNPVMATRFEEVYQSGSDSDIDKGTVPAKQVDFAAELKGTASFIEGTGSNWWKDAEKINTDGIHPKPTDLTAIFKGPLDASDYMKLKDPYGQEWLSNKGPTLHDILGLKPKYSPNINQQINNENLRTTNQCLSGGQKLTGNPIQSNRSKASITTGHLSNRSVISSSSTQIGSSQISVSI